MAFGYQVLGFGSGVVAVAAAARGFFAAGQSANNSASKLKIIDVVNIPSLGNATDFGDLTLERYGGLDGAMTSTTRGCFGGGYIPGVGQGDTIDYITMATAGDATDFGDLSLAKSETGQGSNATRGITMGGYKTTPVAISDDCSYITIASTGDASDFGNLSILSYGTNCSNNTTRLVVHLGREGLPYQTIYTRDTIEYVTIASTGNTADFGDSTVARTYSAGGVSSLTRGCHSGGAAPGDSDVIDYITIASLGNATDFGNLIAGIAYASGCCNLTRGLVAGSGYATASNVIQYYTIASTGDAADFGDLTTTNFGMFSGSNAHGGLG